MFSRNAAYVAAAAFLGLIAVLIANAYFSGVEERSENAVQQEELARIVVASQPLEFGAKLTPQNVRLQAWPAASIPTGAFRSVDAALRNNRVALRPIVVGEPVLADKVSGKDGRATLAANLPEGMRAVTIPISSVSGVAGFVLPGTTVDVLLTRKIPIEGTTGNDQMVNVVLENVQVLAIDQLADTKTGKPKPGKTATLQTDLFGAQKLVLAEKIGSLSLVLRNVEHQGPAGGTVVTQRDLGGLPTIRRPRMINPVQGLPANVQQAFQSAPMAPPAPSGPVMTVYRGTEQADYAVGRLGGR